MSSDKEKRGSNWGTFAKVLTAVAALLGAVGGLLATLDAMDVLGGDPDGTAPAAPATSNPVTTEAPAVVQSTAATTLTTADRPTTAPPQTVQDRGTISILYQPDASNANCNIFPVVHLADVSVAPSDLVPRMDGVLLGRQSYTISGRVVCTDVFGNASNCIAEGSGEIDVIDGGQYFVVWEFPSLDFGICPFSLAT